MTADGRFVDTAGDRMVFAKGLGWLRVKPLQGASIQALVLEWYRKTWYADRTREEVLREVSDRWKGGPDALFVAELPNGTPVAAVGVDHTHAKGGAAVISHLYVDPKYRGRSLGSSMVGCAEDHLRLLHRPDVLLYCDPGLVDFYRKLGYTEHPTPSGGGEDASEDPPVTTMIKTLLAAR